MKGLALNHLREWMDGCCSFVLQRLRNLISESPQREFCLIDKGKDKRLGLWELLWNEIFSLNSLSLCIEKEYNFHLWYI